MLICWQQPMGSIEIPFAVESLMLQQRLQRVEWQWPGMLPPFSIPRHFVLLSTPLLPFTCSTIPPAPPAPLFFSSPLLSSWPAHLPDSLFL